MEDSYTWKELSTKLEVLCEPLKDLRLDYQWGSVPSYYSLSSWNDNISLNKFKELSFIAGGKLLKEFKTIPELKEIFTTADPLYTWYTALRLLSGYFNINLVADQTKEGVSIGAVYHGSINNVVSVAAMMCMRLTNINPPSLKRKKEIKSEVKNEKKIPKRMEKKIFQEANSTCPFCGEREVSLLDIHHIVARSQGGPNEELNLILTCKKCHTDVEEGQLSITDVMKKKQELIKGKINESKSSNASPIFNISQNKIDSSVIANTVNFKGTKPSKVAHPLGSIGANIDMNNYIKYLIDRYYDFRKADKSYGRNDNFHHSEIHTTIRKKFKAKTYYIKQEKFQDLCEYIYWRIEKTIQGKRNKANGIKNYNSFEEYLKV